MEFAADSTGEIAGVWPEWEGSESMLLRLPFRSAEVERGARATV
jgi:hypothetical protein